MNFPPILSRKWNIHPHPQQTRTFGKIWGSELEFLRLSSWPVGWPRHRYEMRIILIVFSTIYMAEKRRQGTLKKSIIQLHCAVPKVTETRVATNYIRDLVTRFSICHFLKDFVLWIFRWRFEACAVGKVIKYKVSRSISITTLVWLPRWDYLRQLPTINPEKADLIFNLAQFPQTTRNLCQWESFQHILVVFLVRETCIAETARSTAVQLVHSLARYK